ncbi:MAG TPA: hypothetical protein VIP46_11665 [Pyrinomonadaceae bacterium]
MSSDEAMLRLQNALASLAEMGADHEQRISRMEQAYVAVVEMLRRHDQRVDEFSAMRDETDQKLAALVDAQIKAEDEMSRLRSAQAGTGQTLAETDQKLAALVDAQIRAEDEMNKVREALAELAQAMVSLTKKVDAIAGGGQAPG